MKGAPAKDSALLAAIGPEPSGEDAEMAEEYGAEKEDAAQQLLDAIAAGDPAAVVDAFSALKAVC